jgi:hypothetical protein
MEVPMFGLKKFKIYYSMLTNMNAPFWFFIYEYNLYVSSF